MKRNPLIGVAMVLAAAMLWGTTGTAQSFAPPALAAHWVGALRLLAAAAFFAVLWALQRAPGPAVPLPLRGVLVAALCMCVYNLAFFAGVRASGVAVGTAIALGSGPLWAGALQGLWTRRAPPPAWWGGTTVAVAGGALMIAGPGSAGGLTVAGTSPCLLAGLSYAVYALLNQGLVARAPAGRVTGAVFGFAALMALPGAWALAGPPQVARGDWLIIGWLGVMSTGVAYLLFSHALRHISGATGVALALGEPVTAFALAILVVGERPAVSAFIGLGAVLAGLWIVVRAELRAGADLRASRLSTGTRPAAP